MTRKFDINGTSVSLNITEGKSKIKISISMTSYKDEAKESYYLTKRVISSEFKLHKEVYKVMKNLSDKWRMFEVPGFKSKFHEELLDSSAEYALRLSEN